jgi:hypothetical protein
LSEFKTLNNTTRFWDCVKFAASRSSAPFQTAKVEFEGSKSNLLLSASGTHDSHERANGDIFDPRRTRNQQIINKLNKVRGRKLGCDISVRKG